MTSFSSGLAQFKERTIQRLGATFVGTTVELRDSVKLGSAMTGAPAMPVAPGQFARAGALRDSVTLGYPDPNTAILYTTSPYAVDVEDNVKGHQFASGGPHGWKLSVASFSRIVNAVAKRMAGYGR